MSREELIKEYRNNIDKITFFRSLSSYEKELLYTEFDTYEKDNFINEIPSLYLKDFVTSSNNDIKKDIFSRLNENQLKSIYNNLNNDEKNSMVEILNERQLGLLDKIDEARKNITKATDAIKRSEGVINDSTISISNAQMEIETQKQELKQNKVNFKKLERERKKRLQKVLRKSKPSVLDRIGIFSKRRINKLKELTASLEEVNKNIDDLTAYNVEVEEKIERLTASVEKNKQNIIDARDTISKSKDDIHFNAETIKNTQKAIKKVSKEDKRILGRKLYNQQIKEIDAIATRRKMSQNNKKQASQPSQTSSPSKQQQNIQTRVQQPQQQSIKASSQQPKKQSPQTQSNQNQQLNTEEIVNNLIKSLQSLNNMGITCSQPSTNIPSQQNPGLLNNPTFSLNNQQLAIASYVILAVYNYMQQQQQQNQMINAQNLNNGYQRTLNKGSRGVVNLSLLLSLILFIFSLVLFFIK